MATTKTPRSFKGTDKPKKKAVTPRVTKSQVTKSKKPDAVADIVFEVNDAQPVIQQSTLVPESLETPDFSPIVESSPRKKGYLGKSLFMFVVVLVICVLLVIGYLYLSNQQKSENELDRLKNEVSKLMLLPDEEPSLATVIDREELKKQGFFKDAENDDKVLIFADAGKAVLYRPSIKKIIDIVPVQTITPTPTTSPIATPTISDQPTVTPEVSPEVTPTAVSAVILNGTNRPGITANVMNELVARLDYVTVLDRQVAKVRTYDSTLVVALNPDSNVAAQAVADAVGGQIANLPETEDRGSFSADILVIVGADWQ